MARVYSDEEKEEYLAEYHERKRYSNNISKVDR